MEWSEVEWRAGLGWDGMGGRLHAFASIYPVV